MRRILLGIILIAIAACGTQPGIGAKIYQKIYPPEAPTVNIPLSLRMTNYGGGSCVWASTESLLNWNGQTELAQRVRKTYSGGEDPADHNTKMDKIGIRYAMTTQYDIGFLEWAVNTGRGAGVTVDGGAHCINLLDLDANYAWLLDNNSVGQFQKVPRNTFLAEWKSSRHWAFAILTGEPAAPLP